MKLTALGWMITIALSVVSSGIIMAHAAVAAAAIKPNIWFLMADDLDADWKQDHTAIMPALTKYWKHGGMYFENHVAAVPVCGPSRSSLLTSRYPHNNGYKQNGDGPSVDSWCGSNNPHSNMNHTVGGWLARSGYHSAFLGKTVNGCERAANSGWSHWGGLINTYDFYNASIHDVDFAEDGTTPTRVGQPKVMTGVHQAQFLADFSVEQARIAKQRHKPFFIHTTPVMPHWGTCLGPHPADGYRRDDPHWEFPKTAEPGDDQANFLVDPATGRPASLPISPCPTHAHAHDFDGQQNKHVESWNVSAAGVVPKAMSSLSLDAFDSLREDVGWRNRSAAVVDLDDLIHAVFTGFEELGMMDNTYAIFSSDNGYHLGEHKLVFGKGHPYEPSIRLPMYVRGPGVPQGSISALPTTHLDITATILELAGAAHAPHTPSNLDGLSFAAALGSSSAAAQLRKEPEKWRAFSYSEFFGGDITWWNVRTVNSTHKFSVHYWCTGETEVFDLLTDPLQMHNLAGQSEFGHRAVAQVLPNALALSSCAHDSCWRPQPPSLPHLSSNQTYLDCYHVSHSVKHPEWPQGSVSHVGVDHDFKGWSCIPDPQKANTTLVIQVKIDGVLAMALETNISRPGLRNKTPCGGAAERHGFAGWVPEKAWAGKHTFSVFAVNPAPNAKSENATLIQLGATQALCNGVTCGPDNYQTDGALHPTDSGTVAPNDDISSWAAIRFMEMTL